jgi:prephenate dehydratase
MWRREMTRKVKMMLVSVAMAALIALAATAAVPGLVPVENSFPGAVGMMATPIRAGGGGS